MAMVISKIKHLSKGFIHQFYVLDSSRSCIFLCPLQSINATNISKFPILTATLTSTPSGTAGNRAFAPRRPVSPFGTFSYVTNTFFNSSETLRAFVIWNICFSWENKAQNNFFGKLRHPDLKTKITTLFVSISVFRFSRWLFKMFQSQSNFIDKTDVILLVSCQNPADSGTISIFYWTDRLIM